MLSGQTVLVVGASGGIGRATATVLHRNLVAPADLCRPTILRFRAAGGGTVVNVTSWSTRRRAGVRRRPRVGEVTPPAGVAEVIAFPASGRSRHGTGATNDITSADSSK